MGVEGTERVRVGPREIGVRRLGAGPPVVVLNGYAATNADWDPKFLATLATAHELVCLDHRGVGDSSVEAEPFTIEDLARDAGGAIAALGLHRPAVLGWSMGGYVAQALALSEPAAMSALILLSTDPGGRRAIARSPKVQAALLDLSGTPRAQASRLLSLLFPPSVAQSMDAQFGELVAAARARLPVDVLRRQADAMAAWARGGAGGRLADIMAPTLIATGTQDVVVPPQNALRLTEALPDAWLARFRGGGHAFMAQFPQPLARLTTLFLATGDAPTA